ncbi:hypothetical protein HPP92_015733 [Vanilla planifolia]|uniref:Uncharacterized protein n=1 Tax=Vanilla planifolia TaxID=51239 RepID=A0A835URD9_VANPL|nr:hypothetical protein HPP92_015733 [Vanilla planifolia]
MKLLKSNSTKTPQPKSPNPSPKSQKKKLETIDPHLSKTKPTSKQEPKASPANWLDETDAGDDADLISDFRELPSRFHSAFVPDLEKLSTTSKFYFSKTHREISAGFKPFVGQKYAPSIASAASVALVILPLLLVTAVFRYLLRTGSFASLHRALLFVQAYLAIYFATLSLTAVLAGREPLRFFYAASPAAYAWTQAVQTLGYVVYLIAQLIAMVVAFSAGESESSPAKAVGLAQMLLGLAVGLHYYITVFHQAVSGDAPRANWKVHGIYAASFVVICGLGRAVWRKKAYLQDDGVDNGSRMDLSKSYGTPKLLFQAARHQKIQLLSLSRQDSPSRLAFEFFRSKEPHSINTDKLLHLACKSQKAMFRLHRLKLSLLQKSRVFYLSFLQTRFSNHKFQCRGYGNTSKYRDGKLTRNMLEEEEESLGPQSLGKYVVPTALLVLVGAGAFIHYNDERRAIPKGSERTTAIGKADTNKPAIGGPFKLFDTENCLVTDSNLRGNWVLLYFGYTSSPDVGPAEVEKMAKAISILESQHNLKVLPVYITIDPQRDSPDQLKAYLKEFNPRITGLTGSIAAVRQIAHEYRVFFKKIDEEGQDYLVECSNNMYLLDSNMDTVRWFGIEYDASQLAEGILQEMKKASR